MIPLRYNLRSLLVRRTTSLMTALAVAMVVMMLLLLAGFINGMRRTILLAGARDTWLLLQRGVNNEGGFIARQQFDPIRSRPEIETGRDGRSLISREFVRGFNPSPDQRRLLQFSLIRGVYFADALRVHRGLRIVSGRWPRHGQDEAVVGQALAARFPNLAPGRTFRLGHQQFSIVGVFSDNGSARESEAWIDLDDFAQAFHVTSAGFSAIHVVLKPGSERSFKEALTRNATLLVDAMAEQQYYSDQTKFTDQLRALGLVVALVLAAGAIFGGMNTMYAAVARRVREIGVLRVLGFSRSHILSSFLLESLILGAAGGTAGLALCLAVAALTGLNSRIMSISTLMFSYRLSPAAVAAGLLVAIAIGALGGLMPAIRATRIEVAQSIREA